MADREPHAGTAGTAATAFFVRAHQAVDGGQVVGVKAVAQAQRQGHAQQANEFDVHVGSGVARWHSHARPRGQRARWRQVGPGGAHIGQRRQCGAHWEVEDG